MLQEISDHKSKGAFEKVAEDPPAASVVVRPVEQPVGLESTIQTLWSCIDDKDVGIIGLCGMGGVGKTTLLTKLKNMFSTPQSDFKVVIWAVVSAFYDVGKIQDTIGEHIGFPRSWENKSVEQKARDIYGILSTKRFVVLLDDIWEQVDFNEFGIPEPSQENSSKLIFTTRFLNVCDAMGAKMFWVQPLELEKAWELFQDKVGDEALNSHPDIPNLAKKVAERCHGLPLALITVGRAMACKTTLGEWNYAIETLKRHDEDELLQVEDNSEATENNFFVRAGDQLYEEPDVKAWESVKRMSVMTNKIEVLKETPKCPNLRTLFLSQNELQVISDGFFQLMPHLTVLDLSRNLRLRVLPEGISQLVCLQCLDLSYTGISELPVGLKSLRKLKMLDLSYMHNLRKIPQHLISSFSQLQIFRMWWSGCGDYPNEENVLYGSNEKLMEELNGLQYLDILTIHKKARVV
ncbi:hypothetical protein ERO13_D06G191400v2 [Gossypium hirsutum]|nr:hypothetical protein ERO13_D06G191400v2 [Gossypium hirsutum]